MVPGETIPATGVFVFNDGAPRTALTVANTGDRQILVGSHFHFFEANRALRFDRGAAYGKRLELPAGQYARFEPGQEKQVDLIPYGGRRVVHGFNGLVEGALDDEQVRAAAFRRARDAGFMVEEADGE